MFYQKAQSFSASSLLADNAVRKPLSLFSPCEVKNLTVFILEENALGSEDTAAGLKDFAWKRVFTANSVREGLGIATEAYFDVAILDAEVGGNDSSPVALVVNKRGIPLVICTTMYSAPVASRGKTLVLRNPSPGEKLRAVLQLTDPHRDVDQATTY